MMEHVWISDIQDGQLVDSIYFLRRKSLGKTKAGKAYLTLVLVDRTGDLEGKVWENAEQFDGSIAPGDYVFVQSRAGLYREQVQLTVSYLERVDPITVDVSQFLPACPRDVEEYWQTVTELVASIGDKGLRALCQAVLQDEEIGQGLRAAPAATGVHQAYIGGLLEHNCSMMLLAEKVCEHFPMLNRDLLLAGVLFHDLGKIREMSYSQALDYTDEGRLVGHHVFGVQYLDRLAEKVKDLAPETATMLRHLIISHHGRPEFGSAKVPMFAEAAVLHYLDNLDAKVFGFLTAEAETAQGNWSDKRWFLETMVYKVPREGEPGYSFVLPRGKPAKKAQNKKGKKDLSLFDK
ncbi:MAG: 3'-5' exoribonuclease YhaM family protein [Alphaproteobacteria bacterium]